MALIDIKDCTVKIKDGTITSSGTNTDFLGLVNNVSGYTVGTTTLAIDGVVATALTTGSVVTFISATTGYQLGIDQILVSTIGSTTPTSITISPGLSAAVANNDIVRIYDIGTNTSRNVLEMTIGEGNVSFTEAYNMEYRLDRGNLNTVRKGDEIPLEVSFEFEWDYFNGSSTTGAAPTVREALYNIGNAATWDSTDPDQCAPYAVDIEIYNLPTPSGCGDSEYIVFPDFRVESFAGSLRDSQVSCSGKCNVERFLTVRV